MSKRILTLDVGAHTVKLAEFHLTKDGAVELVNYGIRPVGVDPQEEANRMVYTGAALDELVREMRIKPGPVYLSLSGMHVFSRYVKLPPVAGDKIAQVVEYEARQNIPNLDEVVWDRQILPGNAGEMDVLLAAVKQEVVENLAETVHNSGLETELVEVSVSALYNAYRAAYPDAEGCTMILDMGAKTSNVLFAEGERLWSRSFPVSGNSISQSISNDFKISFGEAEQLKEQVSMVALGGAYEPLEDPQADQVSKCIRGSMTRLHAEIMRSINTYRSQQNGSAPVRILLTGGSSVMSYLDVFLHEKLNIEVQYLNPLEAIRVGAAVDEDRISGDWHLLAEVVGLAQRKFGQAPVQMNLLPPSILRERLFRQKQGVLAASLVVGVALLGLWGWKGSAKAAQLRQERNAYYTQVSELKLWNQRIQGLQKDFVSVEKDLQGYGAVVEARGRWLDILREIRAHLPQGVWITQIAPHEKEGDRKLLLTGSFFKDAVYEDLRSPDNAPITRFQEDLKASPLFSSETRLSRFVTDLASGPAADPKRSVSNFQMEIVLKEPLAL